MIITRQHFDDTQQAPLVRLCGTEYRLRSFNISSHRTSSLRLGNGNGTGNGAGNGAYKLQITLNSTNVIIPKYEPGHGKIPSAETAYREQHMKPTAQACPTLECCHTVTQTSSTVTWLI